jgi:hypothetical protein
MANERLLLYLKRQYELSEDCRFFVGQPKRRHTWTAGKNELTELIYALYADRCLDDGRITLSRTISYMELLFNIDLGNAMRNFADMKVRNTPTPFLDRLKTRLLEKMNRTEAEQQADEEDEDF